MNFESENKIINNHLPWLDGLRGGAALWVLLSHVQILTGMRYIPLLSWGGLAVDLFMMLSGFLMAHHYIERQKKEPWGSFKTFYMFWIRRFFRIAPLYYVLLMVALFFGPSLGEYRTEIATVWPDTATPLARYLDQSFFNIISHITFMFGFLPDFAFRTPLPDWSIGLEMQFYLVFPLIMLTFLRLGPIKTSVILILFCLTIQTVFIGYFQHFQMPAFLPIKLYVFLIGIWIAVARMQHSMRLGFFFALGISFLWFAFERTPLSGARAVLVIIMFYLMDNGTMPASQLLRNLLDKIRGYLSSPLSRFMGDTSYASYLLHLIIVLPIAGTLAKYDQYQLLPSSIRFGLCLLIVLPIVYIISWGLYFSVEKWGISTGKVILRHFQR